MFASIFRETLKLLYSNNPNIVHKTKTKDKTKDKTILSHFIFICNIFPFALYGNESENPIIRAFPYFWQIQSLLL